MCEKCDESEILWAGVLYSDIGDLDNLEYESWEALGDILFEEMREQQRNCRISSGESIIEVIADDFFKSAMDSLNVKTSD